ncbi:MAG: class I SAM-dependent methyltransferase [Ignavibacterium album]|jgi:ubiquinone/menaquinone biosynthesis C-methylase UbiE|uniref:Class I SAM-dependent methyltransferase n=1 Tax=Ignavibacterium album TaxID=591197 RepID=A0A7V3E8X5_9BACT|nr:class I SAM-dependent methyltransferase [Ignavibacterium album]MCX8104827.1 class I SAM-dependent methyltransferase [Ignavibacterium album]
MNVKEAYNLWANQYDTDENKTRDLEAKALRTTLDKITFKSCLEIGCGTGKNTEWLMTKAHRVLAIDLSEKMLSKAKDKIKSDTVRFILADITNDWDFINNEKFDLVTFSLVLEHIKDLDGIFEKLTSVVSENGFIYIGELHPFKQYTGTKARFETENGIQELTCFNHNISDFTKAAQRYGFQLKDLNEYFDNNERTNIPRILTLLFQKESQIDVH